MCSGQDCPLKETCYRFTATPSEFRQSYFLNIPYKMCPKRPRTLGSLVQGVVKTRKLKLVNTNGKEI